MIFLAWQTTPEMTEQPHLLLAWVGRCIKEFEKPAPLLGQLGELYFEKLTQNSNQKPATFISPSSVDRHVSHGQCCCSTEDVTFKVGLSRKPSSQI